MTRVLPTNIDTVRRRAGDRRRGKRRHFQLEQLENRHLLAGAHVVIDDSLSEMDESAEVSGSIAWRHHLESMLARRGGYTPSSRWNAGPTSEAQSSGELREPAWLQSELPDFWMTNLAKAADLSRYGLETLGRAKRWEILVDPGTTGDDLAAMISDARGSIEGKPLDDPERVLRADALRASPVVEGLFIVETSALMGGERGSPTSDAEHIIEVLKRVPAIRLFYPDLSLPIEFGVSPNDEFYSGATDPDNSQWYLRNTGATGGAINVDINVEPVWALSPTPSPVTGAYQGLTGDGIVVGIVDTGIDVNHSDLMGNVGTNGFNFITGMQGPLTPNIPVTCQGVNQSCHGTAVAGIVAAIGNNDVGISGVAPAAEIAPLKVVVNSNSQLALALDHDNTSPEKVDIYNLSFATDSSHAGDLSRYTPDVLNSIRNGALNGRNGLGNIYVKSSGNSYPVANANYDAVSISRYTITVAGVNHNGLHAIYSDHGSPGGSVAGANVLISAPTEGDGARILTTDITGSLGYSTTDYVITGGTSMSAPMVSGVVALMLQANPTLTWRDVQHILVETARKVHPDKHVNPQVPESLDYGWRPNAAGYFVNHLYGFGLIDAEAAVRAATTWTNVTPEVTYESGELTVGEAIKNSTGVPAPPTVATHSMPSSDVPLRLETVEVDVEWTHPYFPDLEIELTHVSPGGHVTKSRLAEVRQPNNGTVASFAGKNSWTFSSVHHWGETTEGEWSLSITDRNGEHVSGAGQTFDSWQLRFFGTEDTGRTPYGLREEFAQLGTEITGVTVIVPGLDNDSSMLPLATAVRDFADSRPDSQAWLLAYDTGANVFVTNDSTFPSEGIRDWSADEVHCSSGSYCLSVVDGQDVRNADSLLVKSLGSLSNYQENSVTLSFAYDPQDIESADESLRIDVAIDGIVHEAVWRGDAWSDDGDYATHASDWHSVSIPLSSLEGIATATNVEIRFVGPGEMDMTVEDSLPQVAADEILIDNIRVTGILEGEAIPRVIFADDFERGRPSGWDAVDYDFRVVKSSDAGGQGEIVLLYNWNETSDLVSQRVVNEFNIDAAGDELFRVLSELGVVDLSDPLANRRLHFIGHGEGASVVSEATERLARYAVPVDHVTYLDPVDSDQGRLIDGSQQFAHADDPDGIGVVVWNNVVFADTYYQTRGANGTSVPDQIVSQGRPIPGAYNFYLNENNYLPAVDAYGTREISGDHSFVWEGFYLSTVNDQQPQLNEAMGITSGTPALPDGRQIPTHDIGYALSQLKAEEPRGTHPPTYYTPRDQGPWAPGQLYLEFDRVTFSGQNYVAVRNHNSRAENAPSANAPGATATTANQFWQLIQGPFLPQDHQHSPSEIVNRNPGAPNMAGLQDRRTTPDAITNQRSAPNWLMPQTVQINTQAPIELGADQTRATIPAFIADEVGELSFQGFTTSPSADDELVVRVGGVALAPIQGAVDLTISPHSATYHFDVPQSLRRQSQVVSFELLPGADTVVTSVVRLSKVNLSATTFTAQAGDVTFINLKELIPSGSNFVLTGPTSNVSGLLLTPNTAECVGFAADGCLYFQPNLIVDGSSVRVAEPYATFEFDVDIDATTYSRTFSISVTDGYSPSGRNSVVLSSPVGAGQTNSDLDVRRVEQRLRYLNFRGESPSAGAPGPEVIVDGIVDGTTRQAIRLFQAATYPSGKGHPSIHADAIVDVNQRTNRWLNSTDAPFWMEARDGVVNQVDIGHERWDVSWTLQAIEAAIQSRPQLMRVTANEEFGANSLTEYPDVGPTIHSQNAHKSGLNVVWELDEAARAEGTGLIEDLSQIVLDHDDHGWLRLTDLRADLPSPPAANLITAWEADVILDIYALAKQGELEVANVYVGANASEYVRIRQVLQHLGVPRVNHRANHSNSFAVNFYPPHVAEPLSTAARDALIDAVTTLRDSVAPAVTTQPELSTHVDLFNASLAEEFDLQAVVDLAIRQPLKELFDSNASATAADVEQALLHSHNPPGFAQFQGERWSVKPNLSLQPQFNSISPDNPDTSFKLDLVLDGFRANAIIVAASAADGDLRNPSDPTAALEHVMTRIQWPLTIAMDGMDPDTLTIRSGTLRWSAGTLETVNADSRFGVLGVEVVDGVRSIDVALDIDFSPPGTEDAVPLADWQDPFLSSRVNVQIQSNSYYAALPVEIPGLSWTGAADKAVVMTNNDVLGNAETVVEAFNLDELLVLNLIVGGGGIPTSSAPTGISGFTSPFDAMTDRDIVSVIGQLGPLLSSLEPALNVPGGLPFVDANISHLVSFSDVMSDLTFALTTGDDLNFTTLQDAVERLQFAVGLTNVGLSLRGAPAENAFYIDLHFTDAISTDVDGFDLSLDDGTVVPSESLGTAFRGEATVDLSIGFDLNPRQQPVLDATELQSTLLRDLNGQLGVRQTPIGVYDLEVELHNSDDDWNMSLMDVPDAIASFDSGAIPPAIVAELGLTGSAEIDTLQSGTRWRIVDDNLVYYAQKLGAVLSLSGPRYLVDLGGLAPSDTFGDALEAIVEQVGDGSLLSYQILETEIEIDGVSQTSASGIQWTNLSASVSERSGFAIRAWNGSATGVDLGVTGAAYDTDDDQLDEVTFLAAGPRVVDNILDRVFFLEGGSLAVEGGIHLGELFTDVVVHGIDAQIVNGHIGVDLATSLQLRDPGTASGPAGRIYWSEFMLTPVAELVEVQDAMITGSARLPLLDSSSTLADFIDPEHPFTDEVDGPELQLGVSFDPDQPLAGVIVQTVPTPDFEDLFSGLKHFDPNAPADALSQLLDLFHGDSLPFFNQRLPIINQSIDELLQLTDRLAPIVDQLKVNPTQLLSQIQALMPQFDRVTSPLGVIPAIVNELTPGQESQLFEIYERLLEATQGGSETLASLPSRLLSISTALNNFIESLPSSLNTGQIQAFADALDALLPSFDQLAAKITEALAGVQMEDATGEPIPVEIAFNPPADPVAEPGTIEWPNLTFYVPIGYTIVRELKLEQLADLAATIPIVGFDTENATDLQFEVEFEFPLRFAFVLGDLPNEQPGDRLYLSRTTELTIRPAIVQDDDFDSITVTLGGVDAVGLSDIRLAFQAQQDPRVATGSGLNWTIPGSAISDSDSELAFVVVDNGVNPMTIPSTDYTLVGNTLTFVPGAAPPIPPTVILPSAQGASLGFEFPAGTDDYIPMTDVPGLLETNATSAMIGANMFVELPIVGQLAEPIRAFLDPARPSTAHVEMPDLADAMNDLPDEQFECNVSLIADGIERFLDGLEQAINSKVLAALPFISASKLDEFDTLIGDLRSIAKPMLAAMSSTADLQKFLYDNLGPGTGGTGLGLNLLRQGNSLITSVSDIGNWNSGADNRAEVYTSHPQGSCLEFDLHFGGGFGLNTDFDLGLDGFIFDVQSSGGVSLTFDYDVNIGFGVSKSEGPYFIVNDAQPEVALEASAQLDDNTQLSVELAFLKLTAEEGPSEVNTGFSTQAIGLNIGPSDGAAGDVRFPMAELTTTPIAELLIPDFNVVADLDLQLTIGAGLGGDNVPQIGGSILIEGWDVADGLAGVAESSFTLGANLSLGEFFTDLIRPITNRLDGWIKPIRPLLDFLETPVPVYSQVAEFAGQDPIDVADMIRMTGFGGDSLQRLLEILEVIGIVDGIIQTIQDDGIVEFGSIEFDLNQLLLADALLTTDERDSSNDSLMDPQAAMEQTPADAGPFAALAARLDEIGISLEVIKNPLSIFNLFFGQDVDLIRYQGPLAEGGFDAAARFAIFPPVLFATVGAEFNAYFDILRFGLDTYGITNGNNFFDGFFLDASSPVAGANAVVTVGAELDAVIGKGGVRGGVDADISAGWNDITEDGKFRFRELAQRIKQGPHCIFDLSGSLDAFVELFVKIGPFKKNKRLIDERLLDFEVGCGPLPEPVLAHVNGDGQLVLHIGPNAPLRQISGTDGNERLKLTYETEANAIVVEGFGTTQSFDIAASGITSIFGDAGLGNDQVIVDASVTLDVELHGGPGNDRLVGGNGANWLYGEQGDDWLVGGESADPMLAGGSGDDYIEGLGGDDTIDGGSGNDDLDGGGGTDTVTGGSGDDQLAGGDGPDDLDGGDGNDQLDGGDGDDFHLNGGSGDDVVDGGEGEDTLYGGDGNDILHGGSESDILYGGAGDDQLFGGDGNDELTGGDGSDSLDGGEGSDDYLFADLGAGQGDERDTLHETSNGIETLIFTGLSDDLTINLTNGSGRHANGTATRRIRLVQPQLFEHVVGGSGNDTLVDNANDNVFTGGLGDDLYVFGPFLGQADQVIEAAGQGIDGIDFSHLPATMPVTIDMDQSATAVVASHAGRSLTAVGNHLENAFGGAGADTIMGNLHSNLLVGNGGSDIINGNASGDTILGGADADTIEGDGGMDVIHGGLGADVIFGGGESDVIHGNEGADIIEGNDGNDELYGDGGDDRIFGGIGNDTIFAGAGVDFVRGEEDNDTIYGGFGDDKLFGGPGNDIVFGEAGEDRIFGEAGMDTIHGGPHRDFILGGPANDILFGGSGDDFLSGGGDFGVVGAALPPDNTSLFLEQFDAAGNCTGAFGDCLDGNSGHDLVVGGHPVEFEEGVIINQIPLNRLVIDHFQAMLLGDPDLIDPSEDYDPEILDPDDQFIDALDRMLVVREGIGASDGDDVLHGGHDNDLLAGQLGTDYLFGDWGHDLLYPYRIQNIDTTTEDRLEGGPDNDLLCGTLGRNYMVGGTSDHNLAYILGSPGKPFGGPSAGGFQLTTCTTDTPLFVEPLPVEIRGQKFHDINGNGRHGLDEPGLDGWTIELRDGEGELIATTTTHSVDVNEDGVIDPITEMGLYLFQDITVGGDVLDLSYGTYTINELPRSGYLETDPGAPLAGALEQIELPGGIPAAIAVRQIDGVAVSFYTVSLDAGQLAEGVNFGNAKLGSVRGIVWQDTNGNAELESGEPPRVAWTVFIDLNGSLTPDADEPQATTNDFGEYVIENIVPGDYDLLSCAPVSGVRYTFPVDGPFCSTHSLSIDYNQTLHDRNFGNYDTAQLRGTVFEDANGNGELDGGDDMGLASIPGSDMWRVYLDDNGDGIRQPGEMSVTTDAQGNFEFPSMQTGTYRLALEVLDGWQQSSTVENGDGIATPYYPLTVASGDSLSDLDFGVFRYGTIQVQTFDAGNGLFVPGWTVYLDLNENGQLDVDDEGTPLEPRGITAGVGTGSYVFDGLAPGSYVVAELMPEGWTQVVPGIDVDGDPGTFLVHLQSGDIGGALFQNVESASISGILFHDVDGNGLQDDDESGLANWTVFLDYDEDGQFDPFDPFQPEIPGEPFVVTAFDDPRTEDVDETGTYSFLGLLPNGLVELEQYTIAHVLAPGWLQTTPGDAASPTSYQVTLSGGQASTMVDFGVVRGATIEGFVWNDRNGDGVRRLVTTGDQQSASDVGLNGFEIQLIDENNVVVSTITADVDLDGSGADGIDNNDNWNAALDDVGADGIAGTEDEGEGDGFPTLGEPNVDELAEAYDPTERGFFRFTNIPPGTYTMRQVLPTDGLDWVQSVPSVSEGLEYTVTIGDGEIVRAEFGNVRGARISGLKWIDENVNGVLDPGEPRLAGQTIFLDLDYDNELSEGDMQVDTDATGRYEFVPLLPGNYVVMEHILDPSVQVFPGADNLYRHVVRVVEGEDELNVSFGNRSSTSIHGVKWEDLDGDGLREAGEPLLPGWTIYLDLNNNGLRDGGEPATVTNASGAYWFMGIPAGTYSVAEEMQPNWQQTYPSGGVHHIEILLDEVRQRVDFGNRRTDGEIHGTKWYDRDGDAQRDVDEPGLPGVTIYLDLNLNATLDANEPREITDANGHYVFVGLAPGTYAVREVMLQGDSTGDLQIDVSDIDRLLNELTSDDPDLSLDLTGDQQVTLADVTYLVEQVLTTYFGDANLDGTVDRVDYDIIRRHLFESNTSWGTGDFNGDGVTDLRDVNAWVANRNRTRIQWVGTHPTNHVHFVEVTPESRVHAEINFGNYRPLGEIHGTKFHDRNGDGHRDEAEEGLEGWTIFLDRNQDGVWNETEPRTITDVNGDYSFVDLLPQTYIVSEVAQDDWHQTFPLASEGGVHRVSIIGRHVVVGLDFGNQRNNPPRAALVAVGGIAQGPSTVDMPARGALPIPYPTTTLSDAPTAYWRFEESLGVTTIVNVANAGTHNGTLHSSVELRHPGALAGSCNYSAQFNTLAIEGHMSVPFDSALNARSFTVEAWVRATEPRLGLTSRVIIDSYDELARTGYQLNFVSDEGQLLWEFRTGNSRAGNTLRVPATADAWTHLVGTFDVLTGQKLFYVDGQLQASATTTVFPNTVESFYLGSATGFGTGPFFVGAIDEVAFYSQPLGANRVAAHYAAASVELLCDGVIRGNKWGDRNANGQRDPEDTGLANWTIYVDLNNSGQLDASEPFAITDSDGDYAITGLPPGTYLVREVNQSGWTQTFPANVPVVVINDTQTQHTVDFGNAAGRVEIGGTKFEDVNGNGVRDANEPGLSGWRIYLDLNDNGHFDGGEPTDVTDSGGNYLFLADFPWDAPNGSSVVTVREVQRPGYFQTAPSLSLVNPQRYDIPAGPVAVAVADFDGDALLDIATLSQSGGSLAILHNLGDGQFLPQSTTPVGPQPIAMTAADLNGDGIMDLAGVDRTTNTVWVVFSPAQASGPNLTFRTGGQRPIAIVSDDFDQDGSNDLAVVIESSDRVEVYLNDGNGNFSGPLLFSTGDRPTSLATADLDHNGHPDLIVVNANDATFTVQLLTTGGTVLSPPLTFPLFMAPTAATPKIAIGDMDRNGDPDVIVTDPTAGTVHVFRNEGAVGRLLSFSSPDIIPTGTLSDIQVGDFNNDQYPDIAASLATGGVAVVLQDGSGWYREPVRYAGATGFGAVTAGDVNGDGDVDLVATSATASTVEVFQRGALNGHSINFIPGHIYNGLDFGNFEQGRISGHKFRDLNCSGARDPGEPIMSRVMIYVDLNDNHSRDVGEPFGLTNPAGNYLIVGVPPGTHIVREVVPEGYHPSYPAGGEHTVTIQTSGQTVANIDFGNFEHVPLPDGDDILMGYAGDDQLFGDNLVMSNPCILSLGGDDHLIGMEGDDTLAGQLRNDTYYFGPATDNEVDTIVELEGFGTNDRTDEGIHDRLDFHGVDMNGDGTLELQGLGPDEPVHVDLSGTPPANWTAPNQIAQHGAVGMVRRIITESAGQYEHIEDAIGGDGDDILIANDHDNVLDGGLGADYLQGGAGDDIYRFVVEAAGDADTLVETTGNDTMDFSRIAHPLIADLSGSNPAWAPDQIAEVSTPGGIAIITSPVAHLFENITGGSNNDILIGNDEDNILDGGPGQDQINGLGGDDVLMGGADDDRFVFSGDWGHDTVVEAGGDGLADTVDFSAIALPLTHQFGGMTSDGVGNTVAHRDSVTERLIGGSGTDTLVGPDQTTSWLVTGADSGTVNGQLQFEGIEELLGSSLADDTFAFAEGGSISGTIHGGTGPSMDALDYSLLSNSITLNLSGNSAPMTGEALDIERFVGSSGNDTLVGPITTSTWNITEWDGGDIDQTYYFSSFENLQGQADTQDTFVLSDTQGVSGSLRGGNGSGLDSLDYSSYATGIMVDLSTMMATNIANGIAGFERYTGSSNSFVVSPLNRDTLIGPNAPTAWNVTITNTGFLDGNLRFIGFENLQGGSDDDVFAFSDGASVDGIIDGGDGVDVLDYTAYTTVVTVDLAAGTATGTRGINAIESWIDQDGLPQSAAAAAARNHQDQRRHIRGIDALFADIGARRRRIPFYRLAVELEGET